MFNSIKNKLFTVRSIREAIDSCPGGICFSTTGGRPILVNRRMNELVFELTGHTVIEANTTWDELESISPVNGCTRLRDVWNSSDEGNQVFRMKNGRIWRFRKLILKNGRESTVQIDASDITELYQKSNELYQNNLRLMGIRQRQKDLLENIVEINRDKELLSTKVRIHDELGRCLVATKKALEGGNLTDDSQLLSGWKEAIRDMTNIPLTDRSAGPSPEAELLKVADMIGCHGEFIGRQPTERRALLLLYAAVREALTNAVRHAGADRLSVSISEINFMYHVVISNNGKTRVTSIKEGGGLSSLRRSLEQEGASLRIVCGDCVSLIVDIPA